MKTIALFAVTCMLFCTATFAQKANTDSLSLVSKISDNQLKLGKLQNLVDEKTKNKQNASDRAQQSANENADAASKLSDNPDDRKLARKANNKAGDAKADARTARKEAKRLRQLNDDIKSLNEKIAEDQVKLDKFTGNVPPAKPNS